MNFFQAIVLAIIEGLTEFLPISSTGHMIIASNVMGIAADDYVKMYTVSIQFGAIVSVVALYFKRFFQSFNFYIKLLLGFLPAGIIGFLLNDYIDALLENAIVVAISLVLGGIVLLFIDRLFKSNERSEKKVDGKTAIIIGFFQVLAMVPGVSRSAATIIGGLTQKLNRKTAAEFSFFLAVPTMLVVTVYKTYKYQSTIGFKSADLGMLVLGNVIAFIVGMLAIKFFISFLTKYGFKVFGIYRIILGTVILILFLLGYQLSVV
jgi:undecaprenyl-diphosphatase